MQIGAMQGAGRSPGKVGGGKDPQSDSIRKQISELEKKLREISEDKTLSDKEKLNKQKDIREQIANLQNQLSQRQSEIREERAKAGKGAKRADSAQAASGAEKTADNAVRSALEANDKLARLERSDLLKISMEGRARILENEVKTDEAAGGALKSKKAELSDLKGRISEMNDGMGAMAGEINGADGGRKTAVGNPEDEEKEKEAANQDKQEEAV